jgi:hypothetical protein
LTLIQCAEKFVQSVEHTLDAPVQLVDSLVEPDRCLDERPGFAGPASRAAGANEDSQQTDYTRKLTAILGMVMRLAVIEAAEFDRTFSCEGINPLDSPNQQV